jgi:hypothetical protein
VVYAAFGFLFDPLGRLSKYFTPSYRGFHSTLARSEQVSPPLVSELFTLSASGQTPYLITLLILKVND